MSRYPDYPPPLGLDSTPPPYGSRDTYASRGTRNAHTDNREDGRGDAYGLPPLPPFNSYPDPYVPTEPMPARQRGLTPLAWPPTPIDRYQSDRTGLGGDFGADLYGTRPSNAPYHTTLSPRGASSPHGLSRPGSPTSYTDLNAEYKFVAKAVADFEARNAHAPGYKKRFAPGSDHQQRIEAVMAKAREDFRKQGSGGIGLPEIGSRRFPSPGYGDLDDRREPFDRHFADTQLPRDSRSYARNLPVPPSRDASYRSPLPDPYRKTGDSTRPRTRSPLPPPFPAPHGNAHDSLRPRSRSRPRSSPQPSSRCPSPFRRRRNEVPDEMWNAFFPAWRR